MIRFSGLTKSFRGRPRPSLDHLDLQVSDGEILGLVGLNGAGKTTAIRAACGITLPSGGTVEIDGHDIVREKVAASRELGHVAEVPVFEPQARALDLLEYLAGYHGLSGVEAIRRCVHLLRSVGLQGCEMQRLQSFSQGQRKRFALAAALVASPHNLLLDELLNGLDPEGIRFSRNLLLALRKEGAAILLSGHILTEVQQLADRFAFLHEGRLIQVLNRAQLTEAARPVLRISLLDPRPGVLDLLGRFGKARGEGTSTYTLEELRADPSEVNAALVGEGFRVQELRRDSEDLERYFFRLIGGGS